MIHDMRSDLGATTIPFLIGELGDFIVRDPKRPYVLKSIWHYSTSLLPYRRRGGSTPTGWIMLATKCILTGDR